MGVDDFLDREAVIAAGITAAALSPRIRNVVRRGAVIGVAGVMTAGDAIVGAARGAAQEARTVRESGDGAQPEKETARRRAQRATSEA